MRRSTAQAMGPWHAFTLLELLIVLGIMVLAAGMIANLSSADRREGDVRAAAEELAATLRLARGRAMDQAAIVGVAFNIRNGLDTSGRVLNNRDGGHWYRLIGSDDYNRGSDATPAMSLRPSGLPLPSFYVAGGGLPDKEGLTVHGYLKQIQDAWIGDRHILPPRKVRFLALSDQDNGTMLVPANSSGSRTFVSTYPRPWFGAWLGGRLYPWGGYDPAILDADGRPCSGFYYQGDDTAIIGCRNPISRTTTWETAVAMRGGILAQGAGRPLVNGDWLDYVIVFYPDGSAIEDKVMRGRIASYKNRGGSGTGGAGKGDLGHMTGCSASGIGGDPNWPASPMTSYVDVTGHYAITLCPDVEQDTDQFARAADALRTMLPAYRVVVSRRGQVRVVKIRSYEPAGAAVSYLPAINWNTLVDVRDNYRNLYRTTISGSACIPLGTPVSSFVTAKVLDATGGQRWWISP